MKIFSQTMLDELKIQHPIIMAPMFLVSNQKMMEEAIHSGVMGVFPTLNYRKDEELRATIQHLNTIEGPGNYGVNLIVQKTNPMYKKHLAICVENKVPFYITSLGNPKDVITQAHSYGGKVYCDVTNIAHAQKVADLGADGFVAVGAGAGGHAGKNALHVLVETLKAHFPDKTVVAAGGIASGKALASMQILGASGASIGTRFIACHEATVSNEYKDAICNHGMDDIVMTEKISGTPCAIIDTPYAKKIGYKQNWLERLLSNNKRVRKYFKMIVQYRGMKKMEKAIKPGSYNTLWSAGQSVEMIDQVLTVKEIVEKLMKEHSEALNFNKA